MPDPRQLRTLSATQAGASPVTGPPPTQPTDGLSIDDTRGWRVVLEAPAGQTLAGAGSAACWLYATELGKWIRNPDLDLYSDVGGLGSRTREDAALTVPYGRVYYQAVGITYTGGGAAGVTINYSGWTN